MDCPSSKVIAQLGKPDRDPEVLRHLEECPSCWFDWQIVHDAQQVLYPRGEVRHDLNQRAMARIARLQSRLERRSKGWEYAFSGILVSIGTGAFLLARMGEAFVAPVSAVLGCTVITAIAASLFFFQQEANERGIPSRGS